MHVEAGERFLESLVSGTAAVSRALSFISGPY